MAYADVPDGSQILAELDCRDLRPLQIFLDVRSLVSYDKIRVPEPELASFY